MTSDLPQDPEEWNQYFDEGGPSRPFQVVWALLQNAAGNEDYKDIPLEDLVTEESLAEWDLGRLDQLLEGYGIASRTRYLNPTYAQILLPETPPEGRVVTEETEVWAYAAYVRFIDELNDWRVQAVSPADVQVEELPP